MDRLSSAPSLQWLSVSIVIFIATTNIGCGGGSGGNEKTTVSQDNEPPTVEAGQNQNASEATRVVLFATASDTDGTIASYQWSQTSGVTVSINNPNSDTADFTAPTVTAGQPSISLAFEVKVTDDKGAMASDTVAVIVYPAGTPPPSANCDKTINPGDSFSEAFSTMSDGQTLCLNDGIYNQQMDIPSNINVQAVNDHGAEIDGGGTLGVPWDGALLQLHGSNSSVRGLKVHHAGENSDTCSIGGSNNTMRLMSCSHGGTHKHKIPMKISGSGHLIEDSWFYGEGRYVVQCFIGDHNTIRRNVARWDSTAPNETSEPNATFAIYNCSDIIIENNISLDYGVPETRMRFGGDFYSPQHADAYPTGNQNNHWYGNIAINHAADTDNRRALRLDPDAEARGNIVEDFFVRDSDVGVLANDQLPDLVVEHCTMINVSTTASVPGQPNINCTNDADIQHRYVNQVKTSQLLFPLPQEGLIKADMCASGERQSDWCTTNLSLSEYILN